MVCKSMAGVESQSTPQTDPLKGLTVICGHRYSKFLTSNRVFRVEKMNKVSWGWAKQINKMG